MREPWREMPSGLTTWLAVALALPAVLSWGGCSMKSSPGTEGDGVGGGRRIPAAPRAVVASVPDASSGGGDAGADGGAPGARDAAARTADSGTPRFDARATFADSGGVPIDARARAPQDASSDGGDGSTLAGRPCTGPDDALVDCFATSGIVVAPTYASGGPPPPATTCGNGTTDCVSLYLGGGDDELPSLACLDRDLGARVFRNTGAFSFVDVTAESGLALPSPSHYPGPLTAIAAGDLDHDGCDDVVARPERGYDPSNFFVWRGDCAGHFSDVTDAWGLRSTQPADTTPIGVTLVDTNGDGRLDVVGGRFAPTPDVNAVVVARSVPAGGYALVDANTLGVAASGFPFAIGWSDVDGSGQMDLLVLNEPRCDSDVPWGSGTVHVGKLPSRLFLSQGDGTFAERVVPGIFGDTSACLDSSPMGFAAGDADGDDAWELYVTDFAKQHHYVIGPGLSFSDVASTDGSELLWNIPGAPSSGQLVGWGAAFIDFRRDGHVGLFLTAGKDEGSTAQPHDEVLLAGGGRFDVHSELMPGGTAHCADGITVADFDGDATPDVVTAGWGEEPQLLWNRLHGGAGLSLRLRGTASSTSGIGAKVSVTIGGRTITRELYPGSARRGWSEPRVFFGLGASSVADQVVVKWPSGAVQTLMNVAGGRLTLHEP